MVYERFYEDVQVGDIIRSNTYRLTEEEIIEFARVWDPQPIHIDREYAASTKIGSVFACVAHLVGIITRHFFTYERNVALVAGLGWDHVRFLNPGLPGDSVYVVTRVTSKRQSASNPEVGIVSVETRLMNQNEEIVVSLEGSMMITRRPR